MGDPVSGSVAPLPRVDHVLGRDPVAVVEVGVVSEVEGVYFAVRRNAPVSRDVGYYVHVAVKPDEAAEQRVERPGDRSGMKDGVESIRLFAQQDEYIVGRGVRRVGRYQRERSDDLIERIAHPVEVRGRPECTDDEVLSPAQDTRPTLLDAKFFVPLEHRAEARRVRPQGDGKLLVDVDEALAVVGDLPVHPLARGVGPDVTVNGYLDGNEVGIPRRLYLDDRDPAPRLDNTPVDGRGDREADQVIGVGLSIVRRRCIRRKHDTGEKPGEKRRRPERSA